MLLLFFFFHVSFAQLKPTSIEKEVFPKMAQDDTLFAFDLSGNKNIVLILGKLLQRSAASNCGRDQYAKACESADQGPVSQKYRKAICKTPTRLFCKAGLLICCKGDNN